MGKHFIGYYNDDDPSMIKTHCIDIPNKGDLIERGESFEFGKWLMREIVK